MRSCFKSKWRLYRDSDRLRDGFYYFPPKGTPFYPGVHNLGSRDWTSDERDPWPKLGEYEGARQWYRGTPPARRPLPVFVGSIDCIQRGERSGLPILQNVSANCAKMLPDLCYARDDGIRAATNVHDCVFAKRSADIIAAAYSDLAAAEALAADLLGDDALIRSFEQPHPSTPAGVIGIVANHCVLWLNGTTTFDQLALQGQFFGLGPLNQGLYSTSGLYEGAAIVIADILSQAGVGGVTRFVFVGHSYGGAVVQTLAAKLAIVDPHREIELLTLGAPKAGDARLQALLRGREQSHYVNVRDPIPLLPPRGALAAGLIPIVGPALAAQWSQYARPQNVLVIDDAGNITPSESDDLADDLFFALAFVFQQALDAPRFTAHKIDWYAFRLCLGCVCIPRPCIEPPPEPLIDFEFELVGLEVTDGTETIVIDYAKPAADAISGSTWQYDPLLPDGASAVFSGDPFQVNGTWHVEVIKQRPFGLYVRAQWDIPTDNYLAGFVITDPPALSGSLFLTTVSVGGLKMRPRLG